MRICAIPPGAVDAVWPDALPYLARALADDLGHFTADDVKALLQARRQQLWLLEDGGKCTGAVVTEVAIWPRCKVARIVLAAADDGYRNEWLPLRPVIEDWARAEGCTVMEVYGRPGWERVLPQARRRTVVEWRIAA